MDVRRAAAGALAALVGAAGFVAITSDADAIGPPLTVYIGRSNGTTEPFATAEIGTGWLKVKGALPSVGADSFPNLVNLDNDGDRDALVGELGGFVRAFRNSGTDAAPVWEALPGWEPGVDFGGQAAPAALDIDRDGDLDLLVGNEAGEVLAMRNTGSRTAPAWTRHPLWDIQVGVPRARPAAADFNGDDRTDIVVAVSTGDGLVYRGTGGSLSRTPAWDMPNGGPGISVGAADLNGDGRPDLLIVDTGARTRRAYKNTGSGWQLESKWVTTANRVDGGTGPGGIAIIPGVGLSTPVTTTTRPPAATTTTVVPGNTTSTTRATTNTTTATTATTTTTSTTRPTTTTTGPGGNRAPVARLSTSANAGNPPLAVTLNAAASTDADSDPLSYTFDFGDGTVSRVPVADPAAAVTAAVARYWEADGLRERGSGTNKRDSMPKYEDAARQFARLVDITVAAPAAAREGSQDRVNEVARLYLMRIGHDLGAIYFNNTAAVHQVTDLCVRHGRAYLYHADAVRQAAAGGFPGRTGPPPGGTNIQGLRDQAKAELQRLRCAVPPEENKLEVDASPSTPVSPSIGHTYVRPGSYTARVTVSDGKATSTATAVVNVAGGNPGATTTTTTTTTPTNPGNTTTTTPQVPPPPGGSCSIDNAERTGFGSQTEGGAGGEVIKITTPTQAAVKAAFTKADANSAAGKRSHVQFCTPGPIVFSSRVDVRANNMTVDGGGVTIIGPDSIGALGMKNGMIEFTGDELIIRNMRFRNGGDNLRVTNAKNVVVSHVTSTGAYDDGISFVDVENVTLQWSFLAGNSRSIYIKRGNNVSVHHNWVIKMWSRCPHVESSFVVDVRANVCEDWTNNSIKFQTNSTGNIVGNLIAYSRPGGNNRKGISLLYGPGPVYIAGNTYEGRAVEAVKGTAPEPYPVPAVDGAPAVRARAAAGALPLTEADRWYVNLPWPYEVVESHGIIPGRDNN